MSNKIKLEIYGIPNQVLGGGCSTGGCSNCSSKSTNRSGGCNSSKDNGCGGCGGLSAGCGSKSLKTVEQLFQEMKSFIQESDISGYAEIQFHDIRKINILDNDNIRILYDMNYEFPYCVVDGIVRYYGGIPTNLIYKDIKELIIS